jgi:hypothetical protein
MSEASTPSTNSASTASARPSGSGGDQLTSLVDTLFDIGVGWAATGLKLGKTALEQSAKTLDQTAKALENLAKELEKKDGAKS